MIPFTLQSTGMFVEGLFIAATYLTITVLEEFDILTLGLPSLTLAVLHLA